MKVWKLELDVDKYKNLALKNKRDINVLLEQFDGRSMIGGWDPPEVEFLEENRRLKTGDAANLFAGDLVLNTRATTELSEFLDKSTEVLKLKPENIDYYAINVINIVDCLNVDKSEFERYPDTGEIMWCTKYVFLPEKVKGQNIFKIPQTPRALILVSDEFRNKVLSSKLKGLLFKELWDSEKS